MRPRLAPCMVPLLLLAPARPGAAGAPDGKVRIAVLPLKGEVVGRFGDRQEEAYERVAQAFLRTRRFELLDRNRLVAVLGAGGRAAQLDEAGAAALGRRLGVRFLVLGSYRGSLERVVESFPSREGTVYNVFFPARITLNLKLVDAETGQVTQAFEGQGASKETSPAQGITEVMRDLSEKLDREVVNSFPLNGHLARILSETEAVLDLGRADGVAEGDRFLLGDPGPAGRAGSGPRRPEPGQVLPEMKVVAVEESTSIVKISGKPFPLRSGLLLESAPKKPGFWESIGDTLKK